MRTAIWPPGPRGHLLRGHLPELARDRLGTLSRYARERGDFVPLRLGSKRAVLLSHPDYVEEVLVTRQRDFVRDYALHHHRDLLGNGLVTSVGDLWRHQRRLAQPAFQRGQLVAHGGVAAEHTERMLRSWRDGEVRDLHAEMVRLTQQVVGEMLFGADAGSATAEIGAAALAAAVGGMNPRINGLLYALPDGLPLPGRLGYPRAVRRLDRAVYALLERRRTDGVERDDLLSRLLRARDDAGRGLADRQLRDELVTLFVAGYENTAAALSWAWYLLAGHPEVEGRLLAELRAVLGGRPPMADDLPRLRYTEWTVMEALRLYPPVPMTRREAVRTSEIGSYRVPRGTMVLMSQWVLHRDPRHFERPETFNPDRWADGLARRLPRFAYFPFGAGPRTCIGNTLAMMEMMLAVATIAPRFRIEPLPGQGLMLESAATLRPKNGLRAVVRRR